MTKSTRRQQIAGKKGPPLSPRETELVALLIRGQSNATIAGELGIAKKTVQNHLRNIFAKVDPPAWANPRVYLSLLYRE